MTAVKPGLDAAVDLCPACRHGARLHGDIGCKRCDCSLTHTETLGAAALVNIAAPPPSARTLDLLDPECARCGHRRGTHVTTGSAAQCQRCACHNFTTDWEAADAAPAAPPPAPTPPARPVPAPAPAAPPAAPRHVAEAPRRSAAPVAASKRPRLHQPRPVSGARDGEDDADQVVTAVRPPSEAVTTYLDPETLFAHALYVSSRWYCPRCHQWPLDPGACTGCKAPLQAVYHATIPREIT